MAFHHLIVLLFTLEIVLPSQILEPSEIRNFMFSESITGIPEVLIPEKKQYNSDGKVTMETYRITMEKSLQQMLPGKFPMTPVYVYSGQTMNGKFSQSPGPALMVNKNIMTKVTWVNNITGKHMFRLDFNQPFNATNMFQNQVPAIPHVHGISTTSGSDGQPSAFWSASGAKSSNYHTEQPCQKNEAVFIYRNEQNPGLFWYHDHTYGITRFNVYAGLIGFYEIKDEPNSFEEMRLKEYYGQAEKRYFAIVDRTFKTNGELYYPDYSDSQFFTSWITEFFGNTITVNGKVWPQITLTNQNYRLVFLNGCQCRYLNIFFLLEGKKIPFQLIRLEGDYFSTPVVATQYFLSPGARLEILIDLSLVNGEVIMKNNAAAPHPLGDPTNLIDQYTGTIMKIKIVREQTVTFFNNIVLNQRKRQNLPIKQNSKYPAFPQGKPIYSTLIQLEDDEGESMGMYIDGVSMSLGQNCQGSVFELGKIYDLSIINLTPDTHPIHFHLINFQKIYSYQINKRNYIEDWYELNGGKPQKGGFKKVPISLNPEPYRTGNISYPKSYEKVFRDIIDVETFSVVVVRMKFSLNDGSPFGFDARGGRYVWHCHMLQHEDNQMMKYFCVK